MDIYTIDPKTGPGAFNILDWIKSIPGFPIGIVLSIGVFAIILVAIGIKKHTYSD